MSAQRLSTSLVEFVAPACQDDRAEFVEFPEKRNRSSRGAITGVIIGAGLWAGILTLAGVIKI